MTDEGQKRRIHAVSAEVDYYDPLPHADSLTYEEVLTSLRVTFPLWEIWTVPLAVGGYRWCARRHDNHKTLRNSDSPRELASDLRYAEKPS